MPRRITAAVAHDETVAIRLINEHIPEDSGIEVTEVFSSFDLNADAVLRLDVDLMLVACREGSPEALSLVNLWHYWSAPRTPILVLSHGSDQDFVQEAFASGADDFLVLHPGPYIPEQVARDVEFTIQARLGHSQGTQRQATGDRRP